MTGTWSACVLASGLAATFLPGCAVSHPVRLLRATPRLEAERKIYRGLPPQKALAVAGDPNGLFVTGYAFGAATVEEAIADARAFCEARRRDRRVPAPCHLVAENDDDVAGRAGRAAPTDRRGADASRGGP